MTNSGRKPPRFTLRDPRALLRQVLQLDDTPHSIALGASIGMFIGWTPTVGIQMILVLLLAATIGRFLRFNQFAALVGVYVSNPITTVPMYWLMYKVGAVFVGGTATLSRFAEVLHYESFAGWWDTIVTLFVDVGWPLLIGSLIVGTVFALLTYPAMLWLLKKRGGHVHDRSSEVVSTADEHAFEAADSDESRERIPVDTAAK